MWAIVSSIARSSIPSSVQTGSTRTQGDIVGAGAIHLGQVQRRREGRAGGSAGRRGAAHAVQGDGRPGVGQAGHGPFRCLGGDDDEAVDVEIGGAGESFRQRTRQCPVTRAAAGARRGLPRVGVGACFEFPCAEFGQHRRHQRLAARGSASARCSNRSPPAASNARSAWRPYSAASSDNSRIIVWCLPTGRGTAGCAASRCCPRPPSPTASSASGLRPRRGSRRSAHPHGDRCDDLHEHLGTVLVQLGHRDAISRGVCGLNAAAALQRDHPIGQQPGATAVHQHPGPAAAQFLGELFPPIPRASGASFNSRSQRAYRAIPTRSKTARPERSTSRRRAGPARRRR